MPINTKRIDAIDYLRGLVMAGVIINHSLLFPAIYEIFTARGLGWFTDAEAFFLLSGLTMGIVRAGAARKTGLKSVLGKIFDRTKKLYLWHIVLTLGFTLIARYLLEAYKVIAKGGLNTDTGWLELIWKTLTLQYAFGWSDFLIYYIPLLLVSPVLIHVCLKYAKAWIVILVASLLVFVLTRYVYRGAYFYFSIWQVYFMIGLLMGTYPQQIVGWWQGMRTRTREVLAWGTIGLTGLLYAASTIFTFVPTFFEKRAHLIPNDAFRGAVDFITYWSAQLAPYLQSDRTGILRLPVVLIVLSGLLLLYVKFEPFLLRFTGWFFCLLGRHSLHVFILQALILFWVPLYQFPHNYFTNTLVITGLLALVWTLVRYRVFFKVIPT